MGLTVSRVVETGVQKIQAGLSSIPAAQGPSHHRRPGATSFYKWGVTFEDPDLVEAVKNAAEGGIVKRAAKEGAKAGTALKEPTGASLAVKKKATKAGAVKSPTRRAPASKAEAAQARAAVEELVVQGTALRLPASKAALKSPPLRKKAAPAKKVGAKKGARRVVSKTKKGGRSTVQKQ